MNEIRIHETVNSFQRVGVITVHFPVLPSFKTGEIFIQFKNNDDSGKRSASPSLPPPASTEQTTKSPCFSGNHKNNNARKIAITTTSTAELTAYKKCTTGIRILQIRQSRTTTKKIKHRAAKKTSNKCLLTTTPNGTKIVLPAPFFPSTVTIPAIVHFLHFLLMNYGLKIGTAIFPSLAIYHCNSPFFAFLQVPSFGCLFLACFDRFRNLIVLSALKDSHDLISISD